MIEFTVNYYYQSSAVSFLFVIKNPDTGFPGHAVVKNPPADAEDRGSSPGLGRSHMPWSN